MVPTRGVGHRLAWSLNNWWCARPSKQLLAGTCRTGCAQRRRRYLRCPQELHIQGCHEQQRHDGREPDHGRGPLWDPWCASVGQRGQQRASCVRARSSNACAGVRRAARVRVARPPAKACTAHGTHPPLVSFSRHVLHAPPFLPKQEMRSDVSLAGGPCNRCLACCSRALASAHHLCPLVPTITSHHLVMPPCLCRSWCQHPFQ